VVMVAAELAGATMSSEVMVAFLQT
jgi:hypothetical protein